MGSSWRGYIETLISTRASWGGHACWRMHLDEVPGNQEKRARRITNTSSESRTQLTQQFAKSSGGASGFARRQVGAARAPGGYTIIEVMIVLAISGLILASSISIFSGQRAETEFSQAVLDLQSKFQSYSTQVSSANIPSGYTCALQYNSTLNKEYPALTPLANQTTDSTSNQDCLYLGKAIQIVPGNTSIYVYPVLGTRTVWNGTIDTRSFPSTPLQANNEPALDTNGNYVLNEPYQLLNGAKVVSANTNNNSTEQDLLTFYTNLQDSNTSGNEATAYTRVATFATTDVKSTFLKTCIEGGACGAGPAATSLAGNTWQLCVTSSDGRWRSQLNIQSSTNGFVTKTTDGCS